ncbi:H-NS family nucleoid-associated regulatory protein [Bordetella genomosp. 5]|uniref:H-NS family nucleoid-associated regulatory protein n=1 Tax=Bordetella genomosp. 5 TaxID=1395608 RepID=UPI0011400D60|nr:H-NS family nucleoid-associated regulatory protein [Bordetella genomosp. 5]
MEAIEAVPEQRAGRRMRVVAHLLDLMDTHDISIEDIRTAYNEDLHDEMRVAAQYRDPESGQTWAGRGRPPRWIVDGEVTGVSRDRFRVESAPRGRRDREPGNTFGRGLRQQIARDHISDIAHGLAQGGHFDSLTMEQIARATGISRAGLYNHFPLKEAVIGHWVDRRLSDVLAAAVVPAEESGSAGARIQAIWLATVPWWAEHEDYAVPYLHCFFCKQLNSEQAMFPNSFAPLYQRLLLGVNLGAARQSQPFARVARQLQFGYLAALAEWSAEDGADLGDALTGTLRVTGWLD